jgi:hypothetical protein
MKATNDARWVRFGLLPETGPSCERRTNAAVADERGLHTRGQATLAHLRAAAETQVSSLLETLRLPRRLAGRAELSRQQLLRVSQLEAIRARTAGYETT